MEFKDRIKVSNKKEIDNNFYKIYDKNGNFKGKIDIKDEKSLTDEFLYGVTCFVINENNEVLMEVRANTELTPGKIDLVSGHVNGNETGFEAIIRELREEVGIEQVDCRKLFQVNSKAKPLGFESKGKIRNFHIDFYCLFAEREQITKMQKEEIKSLKWVPLELALNMIKDGKTKFPKQQHGKVNYEPIFYKVRKRCLNRNQQEKKVMEK